MKKKFLVVFLAIVSVFALAFGLTACGCGNGGGSSSANGTYYLYENGDYDKSQYITINSGKWTDDDDASGTYTINGESIVFYAEIFGSNEEMFSGTLSDGTLTISVFGANKTYCKEGKAPSGDNGGTDKPSTTEYTITYDANGGTFANETNSTVQKANGGTTLTAPASPSRTNYSFGGWATDKNGNTLWKFATDTVTSNLTLYAVWNEESAVIMSVDGASITDRTINMFVSSDVEYVSLANKVVCSSDSTWRLYYDRLGLTEIPTKIAAQTSGSLGKGENLFYIVVTSSNGTQVNTYELTVYRSFSVSVNYYDNKCELMKTEKTYTGYEYTISYTPTIIGYAFNYWKDSVGKQSALSFTPYSTVNLYADCTPNTYKVTLSANGGSVSSTEKTVSYDKSYALPVPTRTGYSFTGWYLSSTQITDYKGASLENWTYSSDKSLSAKWSANSYTLTVAASDSKAGSVTGGGDYYYDSSVTVTATTNSGYTFLGWYDKSGNQLSDKLSYTFKMGLTATYTAKWTYYTLTTATNDSEAGAFTVKNGVKTTAGTNVTLTVSTNVGYTWLGWYNGEELLSTEISYTFAMPAESVTYTAKWTYYLLTTSSNNVSAGTVTNYNNYKVTAGNEVTITASTNIGYTFVGWYNGETMLTNELSYTFAMPAENVTYTAEWTYFTLTTSSNNTSAGTVTSYINKMITAEQEVTVLATSNNILGYVFLGWYNGNLLLTNDFSYTFAMPAENVTYTAKWRIDENLSKLNFTSTMNTCNISGIKDKTATEIIVPDYVTSISEGAFSGCSNLESITLPFVGGSVKTESDNYQYPLGYIFGMTSYDGGTETKQYYFGDNLSSATNDTYYIPTSLESVTITGGNILRGAFYGCSGLMSVTIPDNVTSIGSCAFYGCSSLMSVTIPDSVTSIGFYAFYACGSLTSINIPDSVTSIGEDAFSNTAYYKDTSNWEDNVLYIGKHLIKANSSISGEYAIKDGTLTIADMAFDYSYHLKNIEIPNSVIYIGNKAFYGCFSLIEVKNLSSLTITTGSINNGYVGCYAKNVYTDTKGESYLSTDENGYIIYDDGSDKILVSYDGTDTDLTLPSGIIQIYNYAFYGCSSLISVTIPDSVTSIGGYAFYNCSGLTSITIPDSVTSIDSRAFYNCDSLTSVTIPNSVTSIGGYAFENCSNLTSVTIGNGVTSIGFYAFYACGSLTSINIPDSVTSIGQDAFSNTAYYKDTSNWEDNVLYIGKHLIKANSSISGEYAIKDGTLTIADKAFYNCGILTSVTIPNSIKSIGYWSFRDCSSLANVTIGNSVTSIGSCAFYGCSSLMSVTIPDSVTSIGGYAFYNCSGLTMVNWNANACTSAGESYSSIFSGCTNLTTVNIGYNVQIIPAYAFYRCSSLTSVTFENTSGWLCSISSTATSGTSISSTDLANTSTAATYLTSTYYGYYWKRS
ncbi:MAG: leucine-rich repeat protein [Candidatus Coproplasma sp.]